jgi:hypothetical protein
MRISVTLLAFALLASTSMQGGGNKGAYQEPLLDTPLEYVSPDHSPQDVNWGGGRSLSGGTYTTLNGWYDFQSNGGALHYFSIDPATGAFHVVYMFSPDSMAPGGTHPNRNVSYAYSTDGGTTWDNFNNVQIPGPPYRAGFPNIDIGTGILETSPVVANHNNLSGGTVYSKLYADSPPGGGVFLELGTAPILGANEPIWPNIASSADGSIIMSASPNVTAGQTTQYTVLAPDLTTWAPWVIYPGVTLVSAGGGRHPVAANGNGKVGILLNNSNGSSGVYWLESTDNGVTWPSSPDTLYGLTRVAGTDTFQSYVHCDVLYNGDEPYVVMDEFNIEPDVPSSPNILFWSPTSGYQLAAPYDPSLYIEEINLPGGITQRFHPFPIGWPVIGMSGSTIGVAYQVFQAETSVVSGFNYSEIYFVKSDDGGMTWSDPVNLTNTPFLDERYPSIARWNPPGEFNIVWQEDTEPGAHAFGDNAPTTRSFQVFTKVMLTSAGEEPSLAKTFALAQNYPNPFNPSTRIAYSIPEKAHVRVTVHNLLGEAVATLVNEERDAGSYEVMFRADELSSGVYFYTINAGMFSQTRKMLYLR